MSNITFVFVKLKERYFGKAICNITYHNEFPFQSDIKLLRIDNCILWYIFVVDVNLSLNTLRSI